MKRNITENGLAERRSAALDRKSKPTKARGKSEWIDLPKAESAILRCLREDPSATISEIMVMLPSYEVQTIQNSIWALKRKGLIET